VKIEAIIWFFAPALISLFVLFKTTAISISKKFFLSWLLTLIIWMAIIFSAIMLCNMYFFDAWPSFLPHILIGISLLLLLLQSNLKRNSEQN
jgi:hypothetical protein